MSVKFKYRFPVFIKFLLTGLYIYLFFLPGIIFSQETDSLKTEDREKEEVHYETEDVVISGTRNPEKIVDIPYSVFKTDKKEMKYARNVSVKDILNDVPGLFLQSRYGSHDVRISIRGYGSRSNSGIRGIRMLLDGIPETDPDGETNIDAIDYTSLEAVEVAKGNLSSLYANAPGGVINFITDLGFKNNFLKLTNEFGSYQLRQNGLKTGLIKKNYRFFLSYSYRNFNGFRNHSNEYINLVNSVFQIYPDARTTFSVLGNFASGLIKLPGALTREEYENDPYKAYATAVSSDFKRDLQKGRIAVRYNTSFGNKNENDFELTGYGKVYNLQATTNTLYTYSDKNVYGAFVKFVNKSSIFSKKNQFSTGIDYAFANGPISSYANINGKKGDDLQQQNKEALTNFGIYIQDQFYIYKDKSAIFFAGRYDNMKYQNDNMLFGLQNSQRKFNRFTPKIALNYKLTPLIALYTSYGYAFDTPAAAELENYPYSSNNGLTTLNPDLNPQKSKNFELGIKGNFSDRKIELEKAFFEVTLFNTIVDDEIVPFVINDKTYFRNAATTTRTGVESGIKIEMFEGLEVQANYTFANFNYDKYNAVSYSSGGDTINENYSGNVVPSVPKHLVNFILNYEVKLNKNFTGLLLADMDYVGSMFVDDKNSQSVSDYYYANFLIGANAVFDKFNVLVSGGMNNIFDRKYVGFININANPELPESARRYFEPGEPRSYYLGINLGYTF